MSLITPHLYLGDANNASDIDFLRKKRVSLIINCAMEIKNVFPKEFNYIRMEWDDVPGQKIQADLQKVSDIIINRMKKGEVVFVHCAMGISRSSSVVIYTLMKFHKWTYEKAFKYVRDMHPRTNPNVGFIEQMVKMQPSQNPHPRITTNTHDTPDSHETYLEIIPEVIDSTISESPQNYDFRSPHKIKENTGPDLYQHKQNRYHIMENYQKDNTPNNNSQRDYNAEEPFGGYLYGEPKPIQNAMGKLTLDCKDCDKVNYIKNGKGMYANIFS
jgi:protein-tyrosine phosphatase